LVVDAFVGPITNLQRLVAGEDEVFAACVGDAWHAMALIEA
jgi:hypothetical protein